MKQSALTLVTPVIGDQQPALYDIIKNVRTDLDAGTFTLFEDVGTIHYARIVILKDQLSNGKCNLVFSSDYDGTETEHLLRIGTIAASMVDGLYQHCEGYPSTTERNPESRKNYLCRWVVKEASFYVGAPGRTVGQIRKESELRNYIWNILNHGSWDGQSALEVHKTVRNKVLSDQQNSWVKEPIKLPRPRRIVFVLLGVALLLTVPLTLFVAKKAGVPLRDEVFTTKGIIISIVSLPILLITFLVIWILIIQFRFENKDKPLGLTPSQIDEDHVKMLEEYEDVHNQNQFTQIIQMKPGWMRLCTLKGLMLFARFMVFTEFRLGKLMGIPTIHFARWVILDNNRQVLFFSNFDGSWQQYLGDFIDKSGWGLSGIFSNTMDFPKTKFLFTKGAYDEEHFLAWARYTQIPTAVWYCAYPHLSIKNINNNSAIRYELMEDLTESQAQNFLKRF